jgi:multidrug efflux pump
MRISEISIRRPVLAIVISLLLVIFGLVSLERLSTREYPDIDRPVVSITTYYSGASAPVVETKITQVIEDAVAGIEGILKIESDSEDERSQVRIEFDVNRRTTCAIGFRASWACCPRRPIRRRSSKPMRAPSP